jgi:hypothetical protein
MASDPQFRATWLIAPPSGFSAAALANVTPYFIDHLV